MTSRDGSALPAPIWGILLLQTGSGTWEEQPAFTSSNALGGADAVQPVQVQYQVGSGHSLTFYPGYPSWAAWFGTCTWLPLCRACIVGAGTSFLHFHAARQWPANHSVSCPDCALARTGSQYLLPAVWSFALRLSPLEHENIRRCIYQLAQPSEARRN